MQIQADMVINCSSNLIYQQNKISFSPDWKTYLASPCMSSAGQVGGAVSVGSFLSLNVSSNPNPLGPFGPAGTLNRRNQIASLTFSLPVSLFCVHTDTKILRKFVLCQLMAQAL